MAPLLVAAVAFIPAHTHAAEEARPAAAKPPNADYQAALRQGDRAYLEKRFADAAKRYQQAVELAPQKAEAYARLAAAQREQGQFDAAIETLGKGLSTSSTVTERAKLIFLQADIGERRLALPKSKERWTAYLELSGEGEERTIDLDAPEDAEPAPAVQGETVYPATARERIKQIDAAEKRFEQYAAVQARIKKREKEAESKSRSGAK